MEKKTIKINKIIAMGTQVGENNYEMFLETDKGRISANEITEITIVEKPH